VSSGDAGIYALASLAFEVIATGPDSWRRLDVRVVPGLSALQVAAARVGAPLGNDFCAISLSDLLTPWPVIEQRLEAAAAGDFVVALYNPASLRRREGLARALAILARARDPDTPVVIARGLGRAGESVRIVDLARVPHDEIDMLTILIVGARATRGLEVARERRIFTPRGYAAKVGR
jgi:cobalt-precorrin 5A hydrolase/precorrin-3B C17-methyltransferase